MLKKFVSLVVGVSLALATIGVAAASPVHETKSWYDASANTLTVVTTVTNAEKDSTYTYMVYDESVEEPADVEARNIVFIDQKVHTGSGANLAFEFEYGTNNPDKLEGDHVWVGGKANDNTEYTAQGLTVPANVTAPTVTVNGTAKTATFGNYVSADVDNDEYVQITVTGLSGAVASVSVDSTSTENYFSGIGTIWLTKAVILDAETIAITTTAEENLAVRTLDLGYIAHDTAKDVPGAADDEKAVIAVGQVKGEATEYGIVFSTTENFEEATSFVAKAMGKGNTGKFAVKLRAYNKFDNFASVANIYAKAYYTTASGTKYGKVCEVAVGGEDNLAAIGNQAQ